MATAAIKKKTPASKRSTSAASKTTTAKKKSVRKTGAKPIALHSDTPFHDSVLKELDMLTNRVNKVRSKIEADKKKQPKK